MKTKIYLFTIVAMSLVACGGISPELEQVSGTENDHGYIDMGLSVMWSPLNLGASVIGEYGDYYAWGETETKDYFSDENYKWSKGKQNTITKYGINPQNGVVDNLTTLEPEDDAAHVQWGGTWRMPTKEEWIELREKCTWSYSRENGKKGWTATAPNGKSIFFPLAGAQNFNEKSSQNYTGYYRSSTLGEKYSETTYIVIMRSSYNEEDVTWSNGTRIFGLSIRPVCVPIKKIVSDY